MRAAFGAAVFATALAGCDTFYGVSRDAILTAMPDFACVERTIRATPGVGSVWATPQYKGAVRTLYYNHFSEGEPRTIVLLLHQSENDALQFSQSYIRANFRPTQTVIESTRTLMLRVEERVASACEITPISADITEHCLNVSCPSLPVQ